MDLLSLRIDSFHIINRLNHLLTILPGNIENEISLKKIVNKIALFSEYTFSDLLSLCEGLSCNRERAMLQRILLLFDARFHSVMDSRETTFPHDVRLKMLINTVMWLSDGDLISSVGSQGFLSIPLYRSAEVNEGVVLLRLHIWDSSLKRYIEPVYEKFSIHSHVFYGSSIIVSGSLENRVYELDKNDTSSDLSLFKVLWSERRCDQGSVAMLSRLINTEQRVRIHNETSDFYYAGQIYTIDAGEFHRSLADSSGKIAATLFLFDSSLGNKASSYIVGPSNFSEGPKYRYDKFNCSYLIEKLNSSL